MEKKYVVTNVIIKGQLDTKGNILVRNILEINGQYVLIVKFVCDGYVWIVQQLQFVMSVKL